ncbi:MAG: hypothetical protein JKY04_03055, partial [Sneathiella sp.]|nr:hypothetical protein [Sneathiella sp.]
MASVKIAGMLSCLMYGMILLVAEAGTASAADKVAVRAAEHPTYGRLVLDWGRPQKYEAEIRDGFLVISFGTPFEANLRPAEISLGDYLSKGEIYNNNKSLKFKLKGNFTLRTAVYGSAIALDLVKAGPKTATKPAVKMRAGDHPKYSRLVVDWPTRTGFKVSKNGTDFKITFDKSAEIAVGGVTRDLPRLIKKVRALQKDGQTIIEIQSHDAAQIKSFRSGNSIVFDFSAPKNGEKAPGAKDTAENTAKEPVKHVAAPKKLVKPSVPVRKITQSPPVAAKSVPETSDHAALSEAKAPKDVPAAPKAQVAKTPVVE